MSCCFIFLVLSANLIAMQGSYYISYSNLDYIFILKLFWCHGTVDLCESLANGGLAYGGPELF
jgi:hypothetical protein